ncbi:MAG: geranylgeranylglyceryl/heptaprenylglyceryl phosphate synthase [Ignavibacteriaceae bacterium]|jgi:putative glycerol-1-phosphate prenyltransferase|nr:geranylgeranylglyceryl/heptaprenylglyceryl phosphate synthase [Ignavibacteriaceae bacterium]
MKNEVKMVILIQTDFGANDGLMSASSAGSVLRGCVKTPFIKDFFFVSCVLIYFSLFVERMSVYKKLLSIIEKKKACSLILIDPDKLKGEDIKNFLQKCEENGVDGILVGGSLMMSGDFDDFILAVRQATSLPVIIFPGGVSQVNPNADAILFLSIISGRNPEHLIGKHVLAAPLIKKSGIEPISTGYMLIESGGRTTAEYISGSAPIPRNKPEIAVATALAAEYLGMKLVYLEAGSGAQFHVPFEMVKAVTSYCSIPVIVGGGIRDAATAAKMVKAGAKIIVVGNHFEDKDNWKGLKEFTDAVHGHFET